MNLDVPALEKLAERFMPQPSQTGAQIGQLTQLAIMAALEDRSCSCEACGRLRQAVALMKETAPAVNGAKAAPPPPASES